MDNNKKAVPPSDVLKRFKNTVLAIAKQMQYLGITPRDGRATDAFKSKEHKIS